MVVQEMYSGEAKKETNQNVPSDQQNQKGLECQHCQKFSNPLSPVCENCSVPFDLNVDEEPLTKKQKISWLKYFRFGARSLAVLLMIIGLFTFFVFNQSDHAQEICFYALAFFLVSLRVESEKNLER